MAHERGQVAFRNRSVSQSHFAMVPRPDVPRSVFAVDHTYKSTFDAGYLIPVYVEEVLPGDSFKVSMTAFARMSTPLFPIMDNFHLDSFFFFVPNRLVWDRWVHMMGEQRVPTDSVDFTTPQVEFTGVPEVGSLMDYFGLPTTGQLATHSGWTVNALPFRGYQLIYNEWFRDQNLIGSWSTFGYSNGPDLVVANEPPKRRAKKHDYFTSCLPWPQKGDGVTLPLGEKAPVLGIGFGATTGLADKMFYETEIGASTLYPMASAAIGGTQAFDPAKSWWMAQDPATGYPAVYADLSEATSATINALRQAFAVQKLLERDARGGTRYVEILLAHFGVQPQDARLQRPEYLGGGSSPVVVSPIAQTSATGIEGSGSPLGALGAVGTGVAKHGFSYAASEHGFIIGIVNIRSDVTYQQGLRKMWSRRTRYDYYWPAFAHLGEQAVLRKEIFVNGIPAFDELVFGYQERWAEYRYHPSEITGLFRSSAPGNIDEWHAAQQFIAPPVLSEDFIVDYPPMDRILAAGSLAIGQQFLFDSVFSARITRAMPTYSVPGFIDRF